MIKFYFSHFYLILLCFLFVACLSEKNNANKLKQEKKTVSIPKFNKDSAYYFVKEQVDFGPRFLSSKGWANCSDWLEKKLKKYADTLIIQTAPVTTYDQKQHKLKNFIASFSPQKNNRIAFFAHWDTRHVADYDTINQDKPILGANDGGSGVAVLLEIARILKIKNPKIGVDIILFDAEDYGQPEQSMFPIMQDSWCLGSQYWSKNPHKKNYYAKYGVLLDMVAGENAVFTYEEGSYYHAKEILDKFWKKAHQLGFGHHFSFQRTKQIIDDHYYINLLTAIPTIDIIEYDAGSKSNFNKHWHTHGDNMNNINKSTMYAVGQTLLEIIYTE